MGSGEEWANDGPGCFGCGTAVAAALTFLLAFVWRGRRRG